jgi:DNA-binding YbaB/EbfC family protein
MGFEMVMLRMLAFKPHEMSSETKSVKFDGTGEKKVKQVSSPVQVSAADPDISNKPSTDITALNVPLEGENWIDIIGKMGLESVTRELANNCVLVSIDSQSCKLHLAAAYQHLLSPARQQKLQKALQDYAGKPLKLTIAAVDAPIETPAVQTAKAEEERQLAAVEAINSDANIQALKEHFDARILPGTIGPVYYGRYYMKNPLGNIMQQAQKMQENFKKAQEELELMQVLGESGGGLVKIIMTGKREVRKVTIDPSLLGDDKDMLEDLVAAAVNDAVNKVNKMKKEKMAEITAGLPIPPGFQMPF